MKLSKVKFRLFEGGHCTASNHHALAGGTRESINFYATFALIKHPIEGYILFDTGYTERFYQATEIYPYKIYAKATKVFVSPEREATAQLLSLGIKATDIKYIIISHFHADHIGGLRDFTNATFITSRLAYDGIKNLKGLKAVAKGFLPQLMPEDFDQRVNLLTFVGLPNDTILGPTLDLFNDGSIRVVLLEGHADGQIGILLNTDQEEIFLCADAAWLRANYKDMHLPNAIVRLFFGSWHQYKASLLKLHNFHLDSPKTIIVPCHCEVTMYEIFKKQSDGFI